MDIDSVAEGGGRVARPDEDPAVLIHRDASCLDEFRFQIVEVVVVEIELALEGTIREALILLEPVNNLCQDLFEGHSLPFTCRVPSDVSLLSPILAEPRLGLHVGQKVRCDKGLR